MKDGLRPVPRWIRSIARAHLVALNRDDRRVLRYAALLGERIDPTLLAGVLDCELDALQGPLRRLRDCDAIVEDAEGDVPYRFRHALFRQALAEGIPVGMNRRYHARATEGLERATAAVMPVDRLAYHAAEAQIAAKVAVYGERAGDAAAALGAVLEAVRYYGRVLTAAPDDATVARIVAKIGALLVR